MAPTFFTVGPSALWPELPTWWARVHASGLLSRYHRTDAVMDVYRRIAKGFERQHRLPKGYAVALVSSATEVWQVLANWPGAARRLHLYCGSFGQRWHTLAAARTPAANGVPYDCQALPQVPTGYGPGDLICLVHNETSVGAMLPLAFLAQVRAANPGALLAVDATSSLGGVAFDYTVADIWFASVQKNLGLPAGLAVVFLSPQAQAAIEASPDTGHYNAIGRILARARAHQTTHTPNVLGMALLAEMLESTPHLTELDRHTRTAAEGWYRWLVGRQGISAFIQAPEVRSQTTVALRVPPGGAPQLLADAEAAGFVLSAGYGPVAGTMVRLATFPAIPLAAHGRVQDWLDGYRLGGN